MNNLFLIRGLPGSGKSTIAELICQRHNTHHYEADMYFLDESKRYNFDASKLQAAHVWCQRAAAECLEVGKDAVVSNTFTTNAEMAPYLEAAKRYGAKVHVIKAEGNFQDIHRVPKEIIEKMSKRWEGVRP